MEKSTVKVSETEMLARAKHSVVALGPPVSVTLDASKTQKFSRKELQALRGRRAIKVRPILWGFAFLLGFAVCYRPRLPPAMAAPITIPTVEIVASSPVEELVFEPAPAPAPSVQPPKKRKVHKSARKSDDWLAIPIIRPRDWDSK